MAEQIVEMCPNCETEVAVWWDIQKDGYQIFCPYCGKPMMLCSMCDRSPCDWAEEKGCKHSAGKDNNAPTNDGWIPVTERLPEEKKTVLVQWEKYDRYINITLTYLDVMWLDDAEEKVFKTINGVPNGKVIAWRPLPDPYQPERNKT